MSRSTSVLAGLSILVLARAASAAVSPLLAGVTPISVSGALPGPILIGEKAVPLLVAVDKKGEVKGLVAAYVPSGKGAMVAIGHEAFYSAATLKSQPGAKALLSNLLNARATKKPVAVKDAKLVEALRADGVEAIALPKDFVGKLSQYSAVIMPPGDISVAHCQPLKNWVTDGGLLIGGVPGWGYLHNKPGQTLGDDFVAQRLFAPAGLLWADGQLGDLSYMPATDALDPMYRVETQIETADAYTGTNRPTLTADEAKILGSQITMLASAVPATMGDSRRKLTTALSNVKIPIPTPKSPLKETTHPLERAALKSEAIRRRSLPPEQIKADPAAATFPGAVPASAERVTESVAVDTTTPDWHGTGLYAAPGEIVEVTVPASAVGMGLQVQIGVCTDVNYHLASWRRSPEVTTKKPIKSAVTRIASAFGGPVYVIVPDDAPMAEISVKVANAVRMPRFVIGKTDLAAWRETIRNAPGPWADLEGRDIILSLPSSHVRSLEDPAALMEWWDGVGRLQDGLSPRPYGHMRRPERICSDEQISGGYMHSGYPIMCGNDVRAKFVDVNTLKTKGDWGIYHEIGHNHQWRAWTYDGAGEVTNNIFSLYCFEMLQPKADTHPAVIARDKTMAKLWTERGEPDIFKGDPFYALFMFADLRDAFGWEPFKKFFASYAAMPPRELPKGDQAERDGWLIHFSTIVGQNIAPLMDSYGVTTSDDAKAKVAHLPKFDLGPVKKRVAAGQKQSETGKGEDLLKGK